MLPNHHLDTTQPKRFEARISAEKRQYLKFAADLTGRSLTDFVINSAYEAATRVIEEHQQLHLSLKDREVFIKALLNPPKPSENLVRAAKEYKKSVVSK
jgi:uncharacterized protein (DUF1778 family)